MAMLAAPVRAVTGAKPASRGVNWTLLIMALLSLPMIKWAQLTYQRMAWGHNFKHFGTEGCTHGPELPAIEDLSMVFDGVFLGSSDDRESLWYLAHAGPAQTPDGAIYAIWDVDAQTPKTWRLEMRNFPEDVAFHPHGLHFNRDTSEIFVVNHAYAKGGERIDVFKVEETFPQDPLPPIVMPQSDVCGVEEAADWVNWEDDGSLAEDAIDLTGDWTGELAVEEASMEGGEVPAEEKKQSLTKEDKARAAKEAREEAALAKKAAKEALAVARAAEKKLKARLAARSKGLSRGTPPVTLTYSYTVDHDAIRTRTGMLNDVVTVGEDELYVSQWLAFPHPLEGPIQSSHLLDHGAHIGGILAVLLGINLNPIIHCTGFRGGEDSTDCQPLVRGRGVLYNGIAVSPNKRRILVCDSHASQILVFRRNVTDGGLALEQKVDLPYGYGPDNLELDPYAAAEGRESYTIGVVRGFEALKYIHRMKSAKDRSEGADCLISGGSVRLDYDPQSGNYSSALHFSQDGSLLSGISIAAQTRSGSLLAGSFFRDGLLVCKPPEDGWPAPAEWN